jgi:hypothetical protein
MSLSHSLYTSCPLPQVDRVLRYFSSERALRKGISIVRKAHRHVTNKEAFCSLAATDGGVTEACGKLSDRDFYREIQLVCKLINLEKYKKLLETENSPFRTRTADMNQTASDSTHGGLSRQSSRAQSSMGRRPGRGRGSMIMDITRADFERLFAGNQDWGSLALDRGTSMGAIRRPGTAAAGANAGLGLGLGGDLQPSRELLQSRCRPRPLLLCWEILAFFSVVHP